eukprot:1158336-Pelagomonas_calceolata.AAC.1
MPTARYPMALALIAGSFTNSATAIVPRARTEVITTMTRSMLSRVCTRSMTANSGCSPFGSAPMVVPDKDMFRQPGARVPGRQDLWSAIQLDLWCRRRFSSTVAKSLKQLCALTRGAGVPLASQIKFRLQLHTNLVRVCNYKLLWDGKQIKPPCRLNIWAEDHANSTHLHISHAVRNKCHVNPKYKTRQVCTSYVGGLDKGSINQPDNGIRYDPAQHQNQGDCGAHYADKKGHHLGVCELEVARKLGYSGTRMVNGCERGGFGGSQCCTETARTAGHNQTALGMKR